MEPRAVPRPLPSAPSTSLPVSDVPRRRRGALPGLRSRPVVSVLSILAALVAVTVLGTWSPRSAEAAPEPVLDSVCNDALHHRLDVWLGDWRVVGAGGEPIGTSRVERREGGCVVQERWTTTGDEVTGEGVSYVDPADKLWKQLWVDSTGTITRATQVLDSPGVPSDGSLRFAGETTRLDGTSVRSRLTLRPMDEGRLHVMIEHSADDGTTWEAVFDVTYIPAAAGSGAAQTMAPESTPEGTSAPEKTTASSAPVAHPTAPAQPPAAAPAPSSGNVRASSGVVPEEDVPLEKRNRIFLESPMVLEVPIGAIESIPEEYSWSSKDTSVYVCDGVSVRRVTLSRDEHGKTVDVDTVAALYSSDYLAHVDVTAALVWHDEVLAQASEEKISVGRSILSQSQGDGLDKRFTLTVDRSRFDQAFGDSDDRPVLRLTVTVRE